jgi:hypothetical protein
MSSIGTLHSGETEAVVIIKAAPQVGYKHGETVCCAGIDLHGNWLRLYPISFRSLADGQKFGRWDRIQFRWRLPNDDSRLESRRVDQDSLQIKGELKHSERERFLSNTIVTSLKKERESNRSLALLKAEIDEFLIERKTEPEMAKEKRKFDLLRSQTDLFNSSPIIPYHPCPYQFKYKYRTEDGKREGTCQDWEVEATYFNWLKLYGDTKTLEQMKKVFGEEYPKKGMLLAMGTHSQYPDIWLINGIVRLNDIKQATLF